MIIYETDDSYILIAQHDHARISGDLIKAWDSALFKSDARKDELILGAYEHDRSWFDLDRIPLWNDATGSPFSFRDYPGNIRFSFYSQALDQLQQQSEYAALLGSILYTALAERFRNEDTVPFVEREFSRQSAIIKRLGVDVGLLQQHAKALFLCDELSLFVCMEPPGTPRSQYDWFAEGFQYWFDRSGQTRLIAEWAGKTVIELAPYPFVQPVESELAYRLVSKAAVSQHGIAEAYAREPLLTQKLLFRTKS
jgi:hypothetical protein